ncbi:MAG: hypothetical protein JMN24_05165 [gamma proteobacterium endosymbiont of Lamellibrachia anaximandri]|nr:hypothetical protein [gamma proteobacterium endosymbiont of Lamellibrachia anaximandri]MBL3616228.1 hypothetical protein [gamma proteobacterium endosymbiont of Lamellibrachia anaximandri]
MAIPTLLTIKQFSVKHPAFPVGGLRWNVFNAETNGMASAGVIVRNGRRILLNEERFFTWLERQNDSVAV